MPACDQILIVGWLDKMQAHLDMSQSESLQINAVAAKYGSGQSKRMYRVTKMKRILVQKYNRCLGHFSSAKQILGQSNAVDQHF